MEIEIELIRAQLLCDIKEFMPDCKRGARGIDSYGLSDRMLYKHYDGRCILTPRQLLATTSLKPMNGD
jgi:hypothetical protein